MKELNSHNDETEYELEKISDKAFKLDRQLAETLLKYQKFIMMCIIFLFLLDLLECPILVN
jgi:hypothetical protein